MAVARRVARGCANTVTLLCVIAAVVFLCRAQGKSSRDPAAEAAAQSLVAEAKHLRSLFDQHSARQALQRLETARAHWQRIGDPQPQINALAESAEILIDLSAYQEALKNYGEQLRLSTTAAEKARALNGLSTVHIYLGNQQTALAYCQRAQKLSRLAHDREAEAESLINAGEILYFRGDGEQALRTFNQALDLVADKSWRLRARALIDIGYAYFDLRQMEAALDYYERSLAQSRDLANRRGEALALTAIAGVNAYFGNKQTALNYNHEALALFRTIGDRNGEGVTLNGLGYVYRNLGKPEKSLDCYLQALRLFEALGTREAEYFTITRVGKAYETLGNTTKALEYYERALQRASNYPQTKVNALNSIGAVLQSNGHPERARSYYRQALNIYRAIGDRMGEAGVLNNLGMLTASLGQPANGLQSLSQALDISRAVKDRRGETAVLLNMAKILSQTKDFEGAKKAIEKSLEIIESLRTETASSALRTSYFSTVRQHYELYVDVLMQLSKNSSSGRYAADALAASEKARARSLLELLAESHVTLKNVDPEILQQIRNVEQQLNAHAERRIGLLARRQTDEATRIDKQIEELSAKHEELEGRISSQSAQYGTFSQPQPLTIAQIQQQVLDDDTVLLEYMLGAERGYVWALTRTEISSYELPSRARIETEVRKFREVLTANQTVTDETLTQRQARLRIAAAQYTEAAAALGDLLIAPLRPKLGTKRLLIVPDGALNYIPFQALTISSTSQAADRVPLLVKHEILYEPSASALALVLNETRSRAPRSVAVFANPVFDADDSRVTRGATGSIESSTDQPAAREVFRDVGFADGKIPALPASREEAEAITSILPWGTGLKALGFEANRAAVARPELAQYRIVHFATHGFVDYEHPELSGLVLSLVDQNGQPQDGYLRLHDIYNLRLSANLVVLSACNTGLGKEIKGEGLIGLTRGFMYAGADGVAASLWKVDDEATAELMKRFYEGMFKKGLTPAAAIREAQLWMWQQKRWQEPYYWAAFIIQGRYNQAESDGFASARAQWGVTSAGLASALLLAACFFFRRKPTV